MSTDDTAFDRLRAADPATDAAPDLDRIRAAVAAATDLPVAGTAAAAPGEADELARRRRTRTRWLQVAAAVVGVAVVGTGGYLAGTAGGGSDTTAGALPPISLGGAGSSGGADSAATEEMAAAPAAGGSPMSYAGRDSMAMYPGGWYGRTVFSGQGLSTAGGSAVAYGFDAPAVASADTAARIAAALGVAGEPRTEWGSWVVGPNDGSGPTVNVSGDGMVYLNYYDPSRDAWLCEASAGSGVVGDPGVSVLPEPIAEPSAVESTAPAPASSDEPAVAQKEAALAASRPAPDPSVCQAGSTPTGDAAVAVAREALTAVGIDVAAAQVTVDDSSANSEGMPGAGYVYVTFQHVVDGQLTGVQWSVALVGDGVQNLWGPLAPLVELGSYDVVSPAQAVDRLNDPRFGASGGVIAYARDAAVAEPGIAVDQPSQEPTIPPAPTAGAAISWPVQQVTLTTARLGLAQATLTNGAQVLVPAYELSDADGTTWSVVAVVDAQLDFAVE